MYCVQKQHVLRTNSTLSLAVVRITSCLFRRRGFVPFFPFVACDWFMCLDVLLYIPMPSLAKMLGDRLIDCVVCMLSVCYLYIVNRILPIKHNCPYILSFPIKQMSSLVKTFRQHVLSLPPSQKWRHGWYSKKQSHWVGVRYRKNQSGKWIKHTMATTGTKLNVSSWCKWSDVRYVGLLDNDSLRSVNDDDDHSLPKNKSDKKLNFNAI
jgi:hypothetical protein